MARLKQVNWKTFEKFLFAIGCKFKRQKGSHRVYWKEGLNRPVIVPAHPGNLSLRVLKSNLRTLRISDEEFLEILDSL